MKIFLTGATGYIGKRLLPVLIEQGHHVVCGVRDIDRFSPPESIWNKIDTIECDLLDAESLKRIPADIDAAYYLVHSMSTSSDYQQLELESAENFREAVSSTSAEQVIYLSGIVNEDELSKHLESRLNVENELAKGTYHLTTLRAGIIIGSGSASFEIIRDLVEKLPIMITPKWLNTKCQPIGVQDVIEFLKRSLGRKETYDQNFDIGGPDIVSYKEMLLQFAKKRGLKRIIRTVPVMTPRLSSYWLYFVTSTSYKLAVALVNSMKIEVICRDNRLAEMLDIKPAIYDKALERTLDKIASNEIVSSWKDSQVSGRLEYNISDFIKVPEYGVYVDSRKRKINDLEKCKERIWQIGGDTGWYYANFLWKIRGFMDQLVGGVGLRRGRTSVTNLNVGDAVDFWRVLYADKEEGRLLLFAEMKLPGEAWLEFKVEKDHLTQNATFRPKGLAGRLYWYAVSPLHELIFGGMIRRITKN